MSFSKKRMRWVSAAAVPLLIALTACSANAPESGGEEQVRVAFLNVSAANTYLASARDAMADYADEENVEITDFDAKFDAGVQANQIQDVISSGQYQGVILTALDGAGMVPAVQEALDAGLEVVVLNQIVGDRFDTADPQVDGVAASVVSPPEITGERLGQLTVDACADIDPCRVVYMFGLKGTAFDNAVRAGFDSSVDDAKNVEIVAEPEGGFLGTDEPLKATQDVIQATPEFDVLVGSGDQQVKGAQLALADAGMSSVKLIGVGGSEPAIAGIKDGTWFGTIALAPADEGRFAIEAMVAAIRDSKKTGGIDAVEDLPGGGLITSDNVADFTAQWKG